MPLDIMSSGPTPQTARNALAEAVELFLATAAEIGTLDELLEEVGYEKLKQNGAIVIPNVNASKATAI